MNMTKREVRAALGFTQDKELVSFFGVTKGAVSAWDEEKPIPRERQHELRLRRPDLFVNPFKAAKKPKPAQSEAA